MGAERTPEGNEPERDLEPVEHDASTPDVDPTSIDWSAVPIEDPRWDVFDDLDLDDDSDGPQGAPPDPSQRAWRHPSEVAAANAHMDRFRLQDARSQHPAAQFGGIAQGGGNGRLMLVVAAGALVVAGISIWGNNSDTVISDTAAAVTLVSTPLDEPVATTVSNPAPVTTESKAVGSAQALYAETVTAPPPWAYAVLSSSDDSSAATIATALRIDGLAPEFLITSAAALGLRDEVALAAHDGTDRRGRIVSAMVVGVDANSDIAVLQVDTGDQAPYAAAIGSQHVSQLGTEVEIRSGVPAKAHSGTILSIGDDSIETSAPVPPGHLGAAVVNSRGRVVGVVVDSPSMLATALPATECQRIAANIVDYGVANPNWLGITITALDGLVEVVEVVEGGPADAAGLEVGDRVLGAAGSVVITPEQLSDIVAEHSPTTELEIVVERNGDITTLPVTVGQRPKTPLTRSWVDT